MSTEVVGTQFDEIVHEQMFEDEEDTLDGGEEDTSITETTNAPAPEPAVTEAVDPPKKRRGRPPGSGKKKVAEEPVETKEASSSETVLVVKPEDVSDTLSGNNPSVAIDDEVDETAARVRFAEEEAARNFRWRRLGRR